jgi:hypothetical protein
MPTPIETFVLVELQDLPATGLSFPSCIKRIIRTYLGRNRAQQDCDLLSAERPGTYEVLTIQHIDD